MSAFNVLKPNHFMLGLDFHDALIPPSPKPIPLVPHTVFAPMEGYVGAASVSRAAKVKVEFVDALKRGTDIGIGIPHVGANLLLPLVIAGSGSKSYFGANTVRLEGVGIAVGVLKTQNINLNCGGSTSPPTPTGLVMAPSTVRAGMTQGDLAAGLLHMVAEGTIQYGIGLGLGLIGDGPIEGVLQLLLGYVIGTPLGYSFKGGVLGPLYEKIGKGHDAIADYFNDPSRRVFM